MPTNTTRIIAPGAWLCPDTTATYQRGIDLIAVERAANGDLDPATLTPAEKRAVWQLLLSAGIGHTVAAQRTGTANATTVRHWAEQHGYLTPRI